MRILPTLLATWAAACALPTLACENLPPTVQKCGRLIVKGDKALAVFPIRNEPATWNWQRRATPENEQEFRWMAEIGACNASGAFEPREYGFGASVYRIRDATPRFGKLSELLATTRISVFRRSEVPGTTTYRFIKPESSYAFEKEGYVAVGVGGKQAIGDLTKGKPGYALLTVDTPDAGQSLTCLTKIDYE